jgi:uncharacterized protein
MDITPLLKEVGSKISFDEAEQVSYPEDDLRFDGPVHVRGELVNTGGTILLKGRIEAKVKMTCSRCNEEFNQQLDFDVEEEYSLSRIYFPKAKDYELHGDDFVFGVEKDNTINLTECIRQNILTHIPIMPLCKKEKKNAAT